MREIALAVKLKNKEIIEFLSANVKSKLDFCKTVITNFCDNNFSYLLFACDESFSGACESVIKDIIIDYIESVYKINYLKNQIKAKGSDSLAFNAYVKVLALFDKSTDESALSKIILLNQTFFVDSFLEFRLSPLKKHWDNLATLSSDNLAVLNSASFLDVIKFLLNTIDSVVYKVKVVYDGCNFNIYDMKDRNARVKKIAVCTDSLDLIFKVLNSCPNYIDIYLNSNDNHEAVNFLSNVFANRLKIYIKG